MKKNNNRIPTEKINNNQLKSLLKLIKYMMKYYRLQFIFVIILIFISTISMIIGTLFIREVIDGFIIPNIGNKNIDFSPLIILIGKMCLVYMTGIVSTYSYARIMIGVAQGTLKRLKDDLFTHMEGLPIKYFDTNAHGDIMSIYSSDVDTLRNMITESLAQTISALITIISVIISMFILSIHLTIFAIFMITLIISSTKSPKLISCD